MKIENLSLFCPECSSNEVTIYYDNKKYSLETDPSIEDLAEEFLIDVNELGSLVYYLECNKCNYICKNIIKSTRIEKYEIPDTKVTLPSLGIIFHPISMIPKALYLLVYKDCTFKILKCKKISIDFGSQFSPFNKSYGFPYGTYFISAKLPDIPSFENAYFECIISASAPLILDLNNISFPMQNFDYSKIEFSTKWIDRTGYDALNKISDLMGKRESLKREKELIKEMNEYMKSKKKSKLLYDFSINDISTQNTDAKSLNDFSLQYNTAAYRYLYVIENELRKFIWEKLERVYSDQKEKSQKWWKGCLPQDIREEIEKNMERKIESSKFCSYNFPLYYCNFTGLGKILEKGWNKFFAHKKLDKRPIYGHLAYLEHIRNSVAHNRPLTKMEVKMLYENAESLFDLLGIKLQ